MFEFREITLPPALDTLKNTDSVSQIYFYLQAQNLASASIPDLYFVDLVLIPVDEYSLDTYHPDYDPSPTLVYPGATGNQVTLVITILKI